MHPAVSIVVCTRDRAESLGAALSDLVVQDVPRAGGFEIVVVDDGSVDATESVLADVRRSAPMPFRVVPGGGNGVAHARNVGIAASSGRWVAFFDDDQRTGPRWLATLTDAADRTGAEFVGGPIEVDLPHDVDVGPVVMAIYGEHPPRTRRARGVVPRPAGGNRLIHRRVFDEIGVHDESLEIGEDLDLLTRAAEAGIAFAWAQDAVVRHLIPRERIERPSVVAYAGRAGRARARIDAKRMTRWRLAGSVCVMLAKGAANAVLLVVATARRSHSDALDTRARGALVRGYVAEASGSIIKRSRHR